MNIGNPAFGVDFWWEPEAGASGSSDCNGRRCRVPASPAPVANVVLPCLHGSINLLQWCTSHFNNPGPPGTRFEWFSTAYLLLWPWVADTDISIAPIEYETHMV